MNVRRILPTTLFLLFFAGVAIWSQQVFAQSSGTLTPTEKQEDETNLDTQLYLLVATNQEVADTKLPAVLEPVVKQLRPSLPFKNYRLAATLINRVKNNGRLNLKWIGGPLGVSTEPSINPSFNEFKVNGVRLLTNAGGQSAVRMESFSFGARISIQTGAVAST